jgi:methanogenic corrinoid protein MtbC1
VASTALQSVRQGYVAAVLAGDSVRARALILQRVEHGTSVPEVFVSVLGPAMEEIGDLWACGAVNVAYEHYATAVTQAIVGELAPRMRVAPTSGRLAVIACTPGELHGLGAEMVARFVEGEGWEAFCLGASTPPGDLAELVDTERPDLVALSTTTSEQMPGAVDALAALRTLHPRPYLVVGGQAWRGIARERAVAAGADTRVDDAPGLVALMRERFPAAAAGR